MQVERQFIDVKQRQVVIELPASFLNHRVEVIAITVDEVNGQQPTPAKRRQPHSAIAGKGRTLGDLVSPIVDTVSLANILQLSVVERIQLVETIWDSMAATPENLLITTAQQQELDRRLEAHDQMPETSTPWAEAKKRILWNNSDNIMSS